ncbi:General transcription factor 3C polypeptide 1, partial [Homalodisca vitripennis]
SGVCLQKEERKISVKPLRVISETSSARRRVGRRECAKPDLKESLRQVKKRLNTKKTVRTLKHRKRTGRKPYYDQVDREALLKMSKLKKNKKSKAIIWTIRRVSEDLPFERIEFCFGSCTAMRPSIVVDQHHFRRQHSASFVLNSAAKPMQGDANVTSRYRYSAHTEAEGVANEQAIYRGGGRVDWSAKEDNLLLLCKVAFVIFLFIGKRYQNLIIVRQILHEQCPEATDKTSRACQRRLNYMMKNPQTQRSVNLCVEEMKQDNVVMKKLKDMAEMMNTEGRAKLSQKEREDRWAQCYKDLVLLLQDHYKKLHSQELSRISEGFVLPENAEELLENYRVLRPQKFKKRGFNAIHNVMDIHAGVINSTILSSLNCVGDKTSWSYQLFNIYQQYPDKLLRTVMAKTRSDQMVSLRKRYLRTHIRSGDYLPLSSSPYQLSISYINLLTTRYQFELYGDCLGMYQRLWAAWQDAECPHEEVMATQGGIAACIVEFCSQEQIDFKLEIPDQIIVMDPNVIQKDETYTRIVQRYQDILSKCKDPDQVSTTAIFDDNYKTQTQDSS